MHCSEIYNCSLCSERSVGEYMPIYLMKEREGPRYASGMYELLNYSYKRSKKVIKYFK